jgi:hypothetical protein
MLRVLHSAPSTFCSTERAVVEALTAVLRNVAPCSLVAGYESLQAIYCLQLQEQSTDAWQLAPTELPISTCVKLTVPQSDELSRSEITGSKILRIVEVSMGVKRAEHKADHSTLTNAEFMKT